MADAITWSAWNANTNSVGFAEWNMMSRISTGTMFSDARDFNTSNPIVGVHSFWLPFYRCSWFLSIYFSILSGSLLMLWFNLIICPNSGGFYVFVNIVVLFLIIYVAVLLFIPYLLLLLLLLACLLEFLIVLFLPFLLLFGNCGSWLLWSFIGGAFVVLIGININDI